MTRLILVLAIAAMACGTEAPIGPVRTPAPLTTVQDCAPIPIMPDIPTVYYKRIDGINYVEVKQPDDYPRCYQNPQTGLSYTVQWIRSPVGKEPSSWAACQEEYLYGKKGSNFRSADWRGSRPYAYRVRACHGRAWTKRVCSEWTETAWTE